jgi:Dna[CI] antecedent, DciA
MNVPKNLPMGDPFTMLPREKPSAAAGPRTIGSVMSRLLARTGYDREHGSEGIAAAWQQAVPASMQGCSQAGLVRRGVLEVFVSHSALVQEMGFHKRDVLARLGELVPAEGITDIRCRVMVDAGRDDAAR